MFQKTFGIATKSLTHTIMIAYLKGKVIHKDLDRFIIQTGGVGYEVIAGPQLISQVQKEKDAEVYIHHHVREDNQSLFGFSNLEERHLFQKLLSVSGVGPKSAMAAVSAAPMHEIVLAVQAEDHSVFQAVSGIGPKTAKRLVIELKNKLDSFPVTDLNQKENQGSGSLRLDLLEALTSLGYNPNDIQPILRELDLTTFSLEEAIKEVLKQL